MVIYNAATRELTAKIVYYGPGLCGKTTNLKVLHDRLEPGTAGKLLNLQTQTDRTIYFDLLPVELGDIKGYKIRFQLATVPGQTAFNETRRVVLKGVDGVVFVADSQWTMLPKNLEAWQNLKDNLKVNSITLESIPVVVQYNKRDLNDILAVDAMQEALGLSSYPFVEAVASAGRGVTETFKLISKLTFVDLLRRLQGRRAEEASAAAAAAAAAEEQRQDDLQTWKDSLLKRESQAAVPTQRPSPVLSLVPPVPSDEAPFDTTELSRGVEDEEPASPYSVPAPPGMESLESVAPEPESAGNPAETVRMQAIASDGLADAPEPAGSGDFESLASADEIDIHAMPAPVDRREPDTDPAFLPPEAAADGRIELLEQRLKESEERASREHEAAERMSQAIDALQERVAASTEHLADLGDRYRALESGLGSLNDAVGSVLQRLAPVEAVPEHQQELESGMRGLESGLRDLDERLRSEATRQRKDSDDVGMALRGLTERAQTLDAQIGALINQLGSHEDQMAGLRGLSERVPQLENQILATRTAAEKMPQLEEEILAMRAMADRMPQLSEQVEAVLRQHHELESTFEEKTHQGRREAEDIRSQIAPLLEDRVRRHESDALLFSEMDRLRESLAESLHDLAERLRHAVRE